MCDFYVQACKALNQLHKIDKAKRKESFLLAYLELEYEEQQKGTRTPVCKY